MGKNTKGGSLKLSEKALAMLAQYRDKKAHRDAFIFPELNQLEHIEDKLHVQKTISFATGLIDKILHVSINAIDMISNKKAETLIINISALVARTRFELVTSGL